MALAEIAKRLTSSYHTLACSEGVVFLRVFVLDNSRNMEKPSSEIVYLTDWDDKLTDEWITYAQTAQSSHCRNINAHEKGARYTEDLFHKIDELVLMHAFGAVGDRSHGHV